MAASGTLAPPRTEPAAPASRRARRPVALLTVSYLVAAVLAVPLVFLLIEAQGAGASDVAHLIFRPLTGSLLWNTVRLTVAVTVACAVIGTGAAWCVERTDLPGRRAWAVLVVVPLAIPDFVVSFGWHSLWTWAQGFRGAVIVMTLAVYPLVYLPVAASLRSADPGQEEVARSLGSGRIRVFARITLGQAKGAILGGSLLVALVLLAEYGAFEIVGFQTFTTEIFTEFNGYSFAASCALSLVLVVLSLLVLAGEGLMRGQARVSRTGPMTQRNIPPQRLGRARWPVLALFAALVLLALGVPIASALYWIVDGLPRRCPAGPTCPCSAPPATPPPTADRRPPWPRSWPSPWPCWPSGTPGGCAISWSAAPIWSWVCRAWSSPSPCPISPSATRPGSATARRCCSSPATPSCSSRWRWSGSRPRWSGRRPAWTRWPGRSASAGWPCCCG